MRYTASEIVKRAKELANVANTSFISYDEEKRYLDTAWKNVYQKCINNGSNYWLKEVNIPANGIYVLPDDFFQLESIMSPYTGENLQRYSGTESFGSNTYEIVNNTVRIYGRSMPSNLLMRYYPVPKQLHFPLKPAEVKYEPRENEEVLDYYDGRLLTNQRIINAETGEYIDLELETIDEGFLGKNFAAIWLTIEDVNALAFYNWKGNIVKTVENPKQLIRDEKGRFYYINENDYICDERGRQLSDDPIEEADDTRILCAMWNYTLFASVNGEIDFFGTKIPATSNIYAVDGDRMGVISNYTYYYLKGKVETKELDDNWYIQVGYDAENSIVSDGTDWYIAGWGWDTELDYPNNLLFEVLAYTLAYQYMLKMEAPADSILTALGQITEQFYDSLSADGGYYRIKNVY